MCGWWAVDDAADEVASAAGPGSPVSSEKLRPDWEVMPIGAGVAKVEAAKVVDVCRADRLELEGDTDACNGSSGSNSGSKGDERKMTVLE